ncbi:IclR family transcriptional regulator [Ancylobacter mangrovi]|uniref:IclR family transcriptional regulator n=1 Tax=Ancylobacter mangrovi TaxID=2972472 RepID=UPI002161E71D|nr:IclR family transcriptional regulator [Ancylobacter mangrovi]MCS0501999.1 IclR family transcriptional regulator [Ancylobacter mangrovi]
MPSRPSSHAAREPRIEPSDVTSEMAQVVVQDSVPAHGPATAPGAPREKDDASVTIQSVDRALSILEYIASAREPRRLQDVAAAVGLKVPTCYHLLNSLVKRDFVRRNAHPKFYYLGPKLAELAHRESAAFDIRRGVRGVLKDLARDSQASAAMASLTRTHLELSVEVEAPGGLSFDGYRDDIRRACHATALGKAILAWLPEAEIARVVAEHGLPVFTERTIDSLGELIESLRLVRRHGFAVEDGEYRPGVSALALAIRDPWGAVVGSIGCLIPRDSDEMARLRDLHRQVDAAARSVSAMF